MKFAGGMYLRYTGYVKELANSKALIPTSLTTHPYHPFMYFKLNANIYFLISDMKCVLDSKNSFPEYYPQGVVKILTKQQDGSQIIKEGTWGPRDPGNPLGPWYLTGKGRRVKEQSDGSQIIHEGTWGPMDNPLGPRILTGKGKIVFSNRMGPK